MAPGPIWTHLASKGVHCGSAKCCLDPLKCGHPSVVAIINGTHKLASFYVFADCTILLWFLYTIFQSHQFLHMLLSIMYLPAHGTLAPIQKGKGHAVLCGPRWESINGCIVWRVVQWNLQYRTLRERDNLS